MNKVKIVQTIVKLYFVGALAGSFVHIISAATKLGLSGWESWSTPFMIDGLALIGMVLRSDDFSEATRKLGFRVQMVMGAFSLIANVYAAKNIGGVIYGVMIVALYIAAEWITDRVESSQVDRDREMAVKRSEAALKAAETRKRNARSAKSKRTREVNKLERLIKN